MTGALMEGGVFAALLLIIWAMLPVWFLYKIVADWRSVVAEARQEPVRTLLAGGMLVGMLGWFGWILSDGWLFSGIWSAAIVVFCLAATLAIPSKARK